MIRPEYLHTLFIPKKPGTNQSPPDWSRPFAILTAHNPGGKKVAPETNAQADKDLKRTLSRKSLVKHRVTAVAEDWSHEEKSFAVWGLIHQTASEIGRQYRQDAYFWVENGTVTVHSCQTTNPPAFQRLGRWQDRVKTSGDKPARNIYVIRLDPVGMENKKAFWDANPGYKKGHDLLYVGTSIRSPEERFALHKAGTKSNRFVKNHGLALAYEHFRNSPKLTAKNYRIKEAEYADNLRRQGHAVWQN